MRGAGRFGSGQLAQQLRRGRVAGWTRPKDPIGVVRDT